MLSFLVGTVTYQLFIRIYGLDKKEHLCCSYWHTRMNWKTKWGLSPWTKKNVCGNKLSEWSRCPLKNRIWPYMQQESPQDKFSSPPSTKSASEVLNSAQEVWEEDDIMLQMNDANTCSDQQSTDLLSTKPTGRKTSSKIWQWDLPPWCHLQNLQICTSSLLFVCQNQCKLLCCCKRPGGQLLKHFMCYMSRTHNSHQDSSWLTSVIPK